MKLDKVKRPSGVFSFEVQQVARDDFGEWLYAPKGSAWEAPHDAGTLSFDIVVLVRPQRWQVSWWIDEPERSVAVDICLPPERTPEGWSFVDLELDVVRHASGAVEIEDRDEFEEAGRQGYIAAEVVQIALDTAKAMADTLPCSDTKSRGETSDGKGSRRSRAESPNQLDRTFKMREDVEELGSGSGAESVQAFAESALEFVRARLRGHVA